MDRSRPTYAEELALLIRAFQRLFVERALLETHGNISAAARLAGMDRPNFRRLMKRAGISKPVSQ